MSCSSIRRRRRKRSTEFRFNASLGQTIAFVGPSGSGKTTLVKLLVGLYRPQSGDIRYDGFSINEVDLDDLRERIGLVTQDTQLFSGSIRENLLFVNPTATDEECMTVLKKAACNSLLARADKGSRHADRRRRSESFGRREAAAVDRARFVAAIRIFSCSMKRRRRWIRLPNRRSAKPFAMCRCARTSSRY